MSNPGRSAAQSGGTHHPEACPLTHHPTLPGRSPGHPHTPKRMISAEQASKFLEQHTPPELKPSHLSHLGKAYQQLASTITRWDYHARKNKKTDQEIFISTFGADPTFNPWKTKDGQKLATILYGGPKAHLVPAIWEITRTLPYQTGYSRRPFRRKPDANPLARRLERMRQLYHVGKSGFAGLDLMQTAQYSGYNQWQAPNLALWFAAGLNDPKTGDPLRTLLADIIAGEEEIGLVNRGIIQGLLLTDDPQNWKLIEDLLLAAQRQEGLRQTILESVDETSIGALKHFIGVILEHKLARFSAVVRAVDTWFGFGWEAPKVKTINRVLELAHELIDNEAGVEEKLTAKDSLEVYVALWCMALRSADNALWTASDLLKSDNQVTRLVALQVIREMNLSNKTVGKWIIGSFGEDLERDYWALMSVPAAFEFSDKFFEKLIAYGESLPKTGRKIEGTVFSWQTVEVTPDYFYNFIINRGGKPQLRRLCEGIAKVPSEARERLLRKIFPDNYTWSLSYGSPLDKKKAKKSAGEDWKRDLIRQSATDRNAAVMATGIRFLGALDLEEADRKLIISLLRRKGKELRGELIKVIISQDATTLKEMVAELLTAKSVDQRLAGLEIMTVLYDEDKLTTFVLAQRGLYAQRKKFNKNEEVLLARFDAPLENEISFANGFNVIDFTKLTPLVEPKVQFNKEAGGGLVSKVKSAAQSIVNRTTGGASPFLFPGLVDKKKMFAAFNDLLKLLRKYGKTEYTCWYGEKYSEVVLLENHLGFTDPQAHNLSPREKLNYFPLPEVWKGWYTESGLNDFELLFGIEVLKRDEYQELSGPFEPFLAQYAPQLPEPEMKGTKNEKARALNNVVSLLSNFLNAYADQPTITQFKVDVLEDMIARLPEKLKTVRKIKSKWGFESEVFWARSLQSAVPGNLSAPAYREMAKADLTSLKRLWELQRLLMARTLVQGKDESSIQDVASVKPSRNGKVPTPDPWLTIYLHTQGEISDDDLLQTSLHVPGIFSVMNGNRSLLRWQKIEDLQVPEHLMTPLRNNLLELELQRGDLATDATPYVSQLPVVEGMDYLFRATERLGKETLFRGYSYSSETSKKESFSGILKKSLALETDTAPAFSARAKKSPITTARWLEVAMYAPQWCPWIGQYLKIPDLEIAVWWFHAHASEYMDAQKETIVAQFSPISKEDFREGAIDIDWFHVAYQTVGRKNWRLLHEASKYISDGNGHRQVKTYSSVMLGEVKITETLKKIREKRDKVYVKALGLIPFSRTNPEKDALKRYKLLQQFIHESKQFGAQRQESERTAARIGLDNLARNAGHEDTVRFGWIMEAETTRQIMERSLIGIDNVTVQLIIDESGKPEILVAKAGKPQKSIPAKLRKHKAIVELKEHKAYLRKQFSRTRTSLENAMVSGVSFTAEDLERINRHPVVRPLLSKLVMFSPDTGATGFWQDGQLVDAAGKSHLPAAEEKMLIAHPAHLYRLVQWDLYQKLAFDQQLVQPFKQIFRELYLMTKDEKEAKVQSLRYQGHQIQPRKATALLRTRGWTVSDSEGLQKVYHKQDVIATMYALADWYSPSDVEVPVIEGVTFRSRKGEILKLEDLDPVLFSEVMRDIDLVVSVAHVGGVDPEASHSTLQMRAALARESARLFKADNVEVKKRHIIIEGKHGSYNIHLGSGMVSKGGLQLNIIAVQSQHRGRMFLPFLDDDPKSAEIISKMKLLAEDDRIKDPTVLGQILG